MNKKFLPIFLTVAMLCLAVTPTVTGQTNTPIHTNQQTSIKATGTVTDSHSEVLIGVAVRVKGTKVIAITDAQGSFILNIPQGTKNPILTFNYLGMGEQEIAYLGKPLTVKMVDNNMLDGVVVTGMFNRPKESYTGAATIISSDEMGQAGTRSMVSSIGNIDPSFNIVADLANGSNPNMLPTITMRGYSSLPMGIKDLKDDARSQINTPLFILDGFEISLQRFMDLDESQIENVTLLKDASATSAWGSRGTNGVVMITLKPPISGRLSATYKGQLSIEAPQLSAYNLMNSREKLDFEKAAGLYYVDNPYLCQDLLNLYNQRNLDVERGVDTYWIKYPVRVGFGTYHSARIEGGESAFRYSGSISYRKISGAMKGNERNTYNGGIRFEYNFNRIKFVNDLQIGASSTTESPYGSFDKYAKANSYFTPYDEDGNMLKMLENFIYYSTGVTNKTYNPLYNAKIPSKNTSEGFNIKNNFAIEYNIIPQELILRAGFSYGRESNRSDVYKPGNHTDFDEYVGTDFARKGTYVYSPTYKNSIDAYMKADYTKTINKVHEIILGLRAEIVEKKFEQITFTTEGFSILDMDFIGMANGYEKDRWPTAGESVIRNIGSQFNAVYTYNKRYFANLSAVVDASSEFGSNNRVAPFGSAGVGWNIHHENFLQNNPIIQVAHIKANYGITGKQGFAPYQSITTYRTQKENYMSWNGVALIALGNPDLSWEKTKQFNIGGEFELFDRRFKIEGNIFRKTSENLITDVDLATSSGFSNYKANIGKMRNDGYELRSNVVLLLNRSKQLNWSVGVAVSSVKNKILEVSDALKSYNDAAIKQNGRNPSFLFKEGESYKTIFAVQSKGIDPSNGKEVFVKLDGSETYVWDQKDLIACGVAEPTLRGTLNTSFRFKGWQLIAYFGFTTGGDTYNNTLANKVENIDPSMNADRRAFYDRWQKPGDIAKFKGLTDRSITYPTTRFVMQDKSFTGQSLTISYDVPKAWLNKNLNCQSLIINLNTENFFYMGTVKQERGTAYPYAKNYSMTITARF